MDKAKWSQQPTKPSPPKKQNVNVVVREQDGETPLRDFLEKLPQGSKVRIKPKTVRPDAPGYGDYNMIFTKDKADAVHEILRKKLGNLRTGIDPEMSQAGIQLAGFYIEAGARSFADYTRAMAGDLGDGLRPYLRGWYEAVRHYPGFNNKDMTPSATLDQAADPVAEALDSVPDALLLRESSPKPRRTVMNRYAQQLLKNLQLKDPQMHKRLKKAGELRAFCKTKGEQAQEHKDNLIQAGMRDYEAEEIVIRDLYEL